MIGTQVVALFQSYSVLVITSTRHSKFSLSNIEPSPFRREMKSCRWNTLKNNGFITVIMSISRKPTRKIHHFGAKNLRLAQKSKQIAFQTETPFFQRFWSTEILNFLKHKIVTVFKSFGNNRRSNKIVRRRHMLPVIPWSVLHTTLVEGTCCPWSREACYTRTCRGTCCSWSWLKARAAHEPGWRHVLHLEPSFCVWTDRNISFFTVTRYRSINPIQ